MADTEGIFVRREGRAGGGLVVDRISQDQMPQLDFNTGAAPFTDNDIHAQIVPWPTSRGVADWAGKDLHRFGGRWWWY